MQSTETNQDSKKYHILEQSVILNLLAFFVLLAIIMGISTFVLYFISIFVPPTNLELSNILIESTITLSLSSLIGAISFVTITMTKEVNARIDNAFNKAKLLAVVNQPKIEISFAKLEKMIEELKSEISKKN